MMEIRNKLVNWRRRRRPAAYYMDGVLPTVSQTTTMTTSLLGVMPVGDPARAVFVYSSPPPARSLGRRNRDRCGKCLVASARSVTCPSTPRTQHALQCRMQWDNFPPGDWPKLTHLCMNRWTNKILYCLATANFVINGRNS